MHDWEVIDRYLPFHPRWFETPGRYEPTDEYRSAYAELMPDGPALLRAGLWYVSRARGAPFPYQGWKLHVAASTEESVTVLRRALEVLGPARTPFKFLLDQHILALVNGKIWERTSGGKFMTVYPRDADDFHRLGGRLAEVLEGLSGPYILSDRRWPGSSCVHYRYGGFRPRSVLRVDGTRSFVIESPEHELEPDQRLPYWSPPEWAADPFGLAQRSAGAGLALADGRFEVTSALRFSNRGGVYRGVDRRLGQDIVLKEARPGIGVGRYGLDGISLLEKEWRLLERLAETGHFVRPVAFFRAGEHAFLAEELVVGEHIGRFGIKHNPLYHGEFSSEAFQEYYEAMCGLWAQLARAIASAHELGIVLGDLSFTNLIVTAEGRLQVIDLECALEEGVDPQVGLHTPGVTAPATLQSGTADRANDLYALGAVIFGSVMLANGFTQFHPPALERFIEELDNDLNLPSPLVELIRSLMAASGGPRSAKPVIEAVERLPVNGGAATAAPRLGLPTTERLDGEHRAELSERVAATVEGVTRYLRRVADVDRTDRLYPADLTVFETNPLSVAFGAAGVLYALRRLTGEVPRQHLDWMLRREHPSEDYPPGLYMGQAGIAWVLSELGYPELAVSTMRSARAHDLLWESPDVMCGASGYGLACLKLWCAGLGDEFLEDALRVGEHLLRSSVRDEQGARWPDGAGEVPLGYAYGGSGIALFLLYLHMACGDRTMIEVGRAALDFELDQAVWSDTKLLGFPAAVVADEADEAFVIARCYWDAGSAGVAAALARYGVAAPDPSIEEWLARLAPDLRHKYAVMPQLFHGLAGLGNALLDIYELGGEEQDLTDAWQVAEGVLLFRIECPEGIGFPGEQALRESADFATGAAGIALFLDRLLKARPGINGNFNFVPDELLVPIGSMR